jgi:ribosomal protein L28
MPQLEGKATNLGQLTTHKSTREEVGDCNFCTRNNYRVVFEISGQGLKVRVCHECLKVIKRADR